MAAWWWDGPVLELVLVERTAGDAAPPAAGSGMRSARARPPRLLKEPKLPLEPRADVAGAPAAAGTDNESALGMRPAAAKPPGVPLPLPFERLLLVGATAGPRRGELCALPEPPSARARRRRVADRPRMRGDIEAADCRPAAPLLPLVALLAPAVPELTPPAALPPPGEPLRPGVPTEAAAAPTELVGACKSAPAGRPFGAGVSAGRLLARLLLANAMILSATTAAESVRRAYARCTALRSSRAST